MSDPKDVAYRIALAAGFLAEAEQDFALERWRRRRSMGYKLAAPLVK
jgi:hypothetical protein